MHDPTKSTPNLSTGGFTVLELLIVIISVGILAALVLFLRG
jgi:type II secretory pathway pseudopilin PulG